MFFAYLIVSKHSEDGFMTRNSWSVSALPKLHLLQDTSSPLPDFHTIHLLYYCLGIEPKDLLILVVPAAISNGEKTKRIKPRTRTEAKKNGTEASILTSTWQEANTESRTVMDGQEQS